MTVLDFIKQTLMAEFRQIQRDENHHYLSFSLIAQGIEFLGACMDSDDFGKQHVSERRFRAAISQLFPAKYHGYNGKGVPHDLYGSLRCSLLHVVLPKADVELIQRGEKKKFSADHLEIKNIRGRDRLVLVSEDFLQDFHGACRKVIKQIRAGTLSHPKLRGELLLTEP